MEVNGFKPGDFKAVPEENNQFLCDGCFFDGRDDLCVSEFPPEFFREIEGAGSTDNKCKGIIFKLKNNK